MIGWGRGIRRDGEGLSENIEYRFTTAEAEVLTIQQRAKADDVAPTHGAYRPRVVEA